MNSLSESEFRKLVKSTFKYENLGADLSFLTLSLINMGYFLLLSRYPRREDEKLIF